MTDKEAIEIIKKENCGHLCPYEKCEKEECAIYVGLKALEKQK